MKTKFALVFTLFVGSCNNEVKKPSASKTYSSFVRTAFDVEPVLREMDSVDLIFYEDTYGDSLRYSRYFKHVGTADSFFIRQLKDVLFQPIAEYKEVKKCRSEGKMQVLRKQDPIKTIYFSTRGDSCSYVYFIKDGNFYYTSVSDAFRSFISSKQKKLGL